MRRAVSFDVDGTLVDTERDGHRVAFNRAFEDAGLDDHWDAVAYGRLLAVAGGRQRIEAHLVGRGVAVPEARRLARHLHALKTQHFVDMVYGGLIRPRAGVTALLGALEARGAALHVVTTGSREWVGPLLDGLFGRGRFDVVVTGEEVTRLKPHPEAYRVLLSRVRLRPEEVMAVEDSAIGLRAATAAGLDCVLVTNHYTAGQDGSGALVVADSFAELSAESLLATEGAVAGGAA